MKNRDLASIRLTRVDNGYVVNLGDPMSSRFEEVVVFETLENLTAWLVDNFEVRK